ncbi:MAG: hypothetical protein MJ057_01210 [Sphaerochaetaceae bacterium]|nr:hypothetical protein [Sphaerochaetaceae bacterium]
MKKAFAILLVVLLAASTVFAATNGGNTVTVKSIVGKITLAQANEQAGNDPTVSGLYELKVNNSDAYTSDKNISQADVVASFTVVQNAETRTNEGIRLDVEASTLAFTENGTTYQTALPAITEFAPVVSSEDCGVENSVTGAAVAINLTYRGVDRAVAKGQVMCSFKATWAQKEELAAHPGTYAANITLAYTIQ